MSVLFKLSALSELSELPALPVLFALFVFLVLPTLSESVNIVKTGNFFRFSGLVWLEFKTINVDRGLNVMAKVGIDDANLNFHSL